MLLDLEVLIGIKVNVAIFIVGPVAVPWLNLVRPLGDLDCLARLSVNLLVIICTRS